MKDYTTLDKILDRTYIPIMKWITCKECGGRYIGKRCVCSVFPWLVLKPGSTLTAENISRIGTAKDIAKLHSKASAVDALSRMEARMGGVTHAGKDAHPTTTTTTKSAGRSGKRRESA